MINNQSDKKFFKKEKVVFLQEDQNDKIYKVISGRVRLLRSYKDGQEMIVRICEKNDFFGDLLLKEEIVTAQAMEDSWVNVTQKEYFLKKMASQEWNDVFLLVVNVCDEFHKFILRMDFCLLNSKKKNKFLERFKSYLQVLPKQYLCLSHEELGKFLNLSRETVTRSLLRLRDQGFIVNPKYSHKRIIFKKEKEA